MRPAESRLCRAMDMCFGLTTWDWMTYGCYFEPDKKLILPLEAAIDYL